MTQLDASACRSGFICDSCYESLTDFSSYRLKILNKHHQLKEFELQTEFLELVQPKLEVEDNEAAGNLQDSENFASTLIKEEPLDIFDSHWLNYSYDGDDLLEETTGPVATTSMVTRSKRCVLRFV